MFGDNAQLQAIRDRFGNTVTVQHASGQTGNITRVVSPNNRWVAFTYDVSGRITQALDNIGRTVGYQYTHRDGCGRSRMRRAASPSSATTRRTGC